MPTSQLSEINKVLRIRARRLSILFSISVLTIINTLAQPVWVPTTPSIGTTGALNIPINYGIDRIGTIYIAIQNYNDPTLYSSATIKAAAIAGPSGTRVYTAVIPVTAGNINTVLQVIATVFAGNTTHTVYIVAANSTGVLQAAPIRLLATTKPCPALDIAFGYTQAQQCVNKGAMLQLNFFPGDPNPDLSGIFPGTKYYIDWGDGNTVSWLSTAVLQVPPLATRQHTYAATTKCNQEVIITVTSACNTLIVKQFKVAAILHGRDIAGDGDGNLLIVDNSTGLSATIQVCEGNTHTITIKDMSIWDCQSPTYIDGSPAPANTDPRTIQWLYGIDDAGGLQNTIGQTLGLLPPVVIGGTNNAIRTVQGYTQPIIFPAAYQGELSQTILIPASCRVGEYFNVYLRNWNKCNAYGVDPPVVTQIQILVVASPAPPIAPSRDICLGDPTTLTASHGVPAGVLFSWYANADKTGWIQDGPTYSPVGLPAGTTTYYVADGSNAGLMCQGPPTAVTLTIRPIIANNTVAAAQTICSGNVPAPLTGSAPTGGNGAYTYQWQSSADNVTFNNIAGATAIGYAPPALIATTWYRRIVSSGPCSDISSSIQIIVRPTPTATVSGTTDVCLGGASPNITFTNPQVLPVTVTYKINAGGNLTINVAASSTATVAAPTGVAGSFAYNLVNVFYQAAPLCTNVLVGSATVTVRPTPTATVSGTTTVCQGVASPNITFTNPQAFPVTVTYKINAGGNLTVNVAASSTATVAAPTGVAGTFAYNLVNVFYQAAPLCTNIIAGSATVTVNPTPTATVSGTTTVCQGDVSPNITFTNPQALPVTVTYKINAGGNLTVNVAASSTATVAAPTGVAGAFAYNLVNVFYQAAPTCTNVIAGSATVTVRPTPTATISGTTTVCQNDVSPNITFTNPQVLPVTVTYKINAGGNLTVNVPASSTATVAAPTGVAGTFAYNLVNVFYQAAPTCTNVIAGSATVTVNPTPTATISGTTDVCLGGASPNITFTNLQVLPVTVTYKINAGGNLTINVAASSTATVAAPTGVAGSFAYNLVNVFYQAAPLCTNVLVGSATVTVRPTPTATVSGTTTVCQGVASPNITFTNPQAFPVTVTYKINAGGNLTVNVAASSTATVAAPTGVAGTFAYNLVNVFYQAAPLCTNIIAGSATVTVNPTPTATVSGTTTVCQGDVSPNITFTNPQALPVTVTYKINAGGNLTVNVAASSTATVAAPTGVAGAFAYNLVNVFYQAAPTCTNVIAGSATVTVRPTPTATISGTTTVCQNDVSPNITFTNPQVLPVTVTYKINAGGNLTVNVPASSTATVAAPTGVAGTFAYNLVNVFYQAAPICTNVIAGSATVTVRPTPTATISGTTSVCLNAASPNITFTNPQILPITVTYKINAGGTLTVNVAPSSTATVAAPTGVADAFVYSLVNVFYQAAPLCTNVIAGSATVTVNPLPVPTINGPSSVCINSIGNIYVTEAGMANYAWVVSAGGIVTAGGGAANNTVTVTWTTAGARTVSVNYIDLNGCTAVAPTVFNVAVGTSPSLATFTGSGDACFGATSTIKSVITGGAPPYTLVIAGYAFSPVVGYLSGTDINLGSMAVGAHNYTLTSVTDACLNLLSPGTAYTININPNPALTSPTAASQTICNNASASIVLNSTVNNSIFDYTVISVPAAGYSWIVGKDPVAGSITDVNGDGTETLIRQLQHNYTSPVTVTYTITPRGPGATACPGASITRTVIVEPTLVITSPNKTICNGTSTALAISTGNTTNNSMYYTWAVSGVGSNISGASSGGANGTALATALSQTLTNSGATAQTVTYDITPWTGTAPGTLLCSGTAIHVVVTVEPTLVITSPNKTICNGTSTALAISTGNTTGNPMYYTWTVSGVGANISGASSGGANGTALATALSQTLTNSGATAQTVTYDITPWTGTAPGTLLCSGTAIHVVVTVEPTLVITSPNKTICNGTSTALAISTGNTTGNPMYYTWTVSGVGANISGASSGGANGTALATALSQTLTNSGATAQSVTYNITPRTGTAPGALLCSGAPIAVVVTVEPALVITSPNKTICNGASTALAISTGNTTGNPMYYTWAVSGVGSNISGASSGGANGTALATALSQTLTNSGATAQTVTYDITPWTGTAPGTLLCSGTAIHVVVTVEPTLVITSPNKTICNGTSTALAISTGNTTGNPMYYTWTVSGVGANISGASSGGANGTALATALSQTLTNSGATAQSVTYNITPRTGTAPGALLCSGAPIAVVVTVEPALVITSPNKTICNGASTALAISTGNTTGNPMYYTWAVSGVGSNISGASSGGANGTALATALSQTLTNSGATAQTVTYDITPWTGTAPGTLLCSGTAIHVVVTVEPTLVITSPNKTICNGTSTALAISTGNTTGNPMYYTWTVSGVGANISGASSGGANGTALATALSQTLTNSGATAQSVTYNITPRTGTAPGALLCSGAPIAVVVTVEPALVITSPNKTICNGASTALAISTGNTTGNPMYYTWAVSGVGSNISGASSGGANGTALATALSQTLTNSGATAQTVTYDITPWTGTAPGTLLCSGTAIHVVVTVEPTLVITSPNKTICNGTSTALAISTGNTTNNPMYYTWAVSGVGANISGASSGGANGTALATALSQTLTNSGATAQTVTYDITPWTGTAPGTLLCSGTAIHVVVTVEPTLVITSPNKTICNGTSTALAISTGNTTGNPMYYTWTVSGVGANISGASSGGANGTALATALSQTLTNSGATAQSVTYNITPRTGTAPGALLCSGAPIAVVVTVEPALVITSPNKTICNGASTALAISTGNTTNNSMYYTWAVSGVGANISGASSGGANGTALATALSQTLTNSGGTAQTVTYDITPWTGTAPGTLLCSGTAIHVVVTVEPTLVITSPNKTICNGTSTALAISTGNTTNNPMYYTWTVSGVGANISGASSGGANGTALATALSQTLTNSGATAQSVTYNITPRTGTAPGTLLCSGAPITTVVTVEPTPVANIVNAAAVICSQGNANININSPSTTSNPLLFDYTVSSTNLGATGGTAYAGGSNVSFPLIISGTLTNSAITPLTVTYTVTAKAGLCSGVPVTTNVTVNPVPIVTPNSQTICSNSIPSITVASNIPATTFTWLVTGITGTITGTLTGNSGTGAAFTETLRNLGAANGTVTYRFTPTAPVGIGGCTGSPVDIAITVKPEPVGSNATGIICSGNTLSYSLQGNINGNNSISSVFTYTVVSSNPGGVPAGPNRVAPSNLPITDTYSNITGALVTITYTITPVSNPGGCTGSVFTYTVTVGSQPVLDPGLSAFACSNVATGLLLKVAGGSVPADYYNVISITVDAGLTPDADNAVANLTAPDTYLSGDKFTNTTGVNKTVTYRVQPILAPSCIGAPVNVVITIRPQPIVFPGQSKTVCSRVAIGKEILLSPPNVPAGSFFNWPAPIMSDGSVQGTAGVNVVADPAGTVHINDQIHNYSSAPITATYTVTPVSQFTCAGTPTPVVITINPEPIPQPISGRDKICVTDKNVVYNVSAVGGSTFHWTVAPAVGTKTFDFNTNAILIDAAAVAGSGNITVYETNSYTCSGDISTLPVQVYAQPASENIVGPTIVCANSTEVYNVTNRAGSVYSWTVPGGAAIVGDPSASSITVIFSNVGGTISVRETNAAGCITNHTPKSITVNPLPTATISGGATICDGASRNLSVDFTGVGPYTFTYALNGVPQAPIATASDPYTLNVTAAGTYTIVNVTDANCTNNGTGTTTVSFFPKPTGTISGTSEMCRGGSSTLTMSFTGTAPFTFTYTDGTTPVTVVGNLTNVYTVAVSPVLNTTYTLVSLTDGNSCTGVVSGSAVISVNLSPAITLTGTNLTCYNVPTGAVSMAIADGTTPFGYSWTGPSGFTANTQNISSLEAGYYAVVVNDSKGCTGTANITLTQPAVLNGSAAGTNITCFGASDGTITISGSTGGSGTYEYTRNGGGIWQAAPVFTALGPGTYNVMMRDAVNQTCIKVLNNNLLLTAPAVLNATITKTDINCFGAANGSIIISAPSGGYGTYGYSINGGGTWQGSGNFTNVPSGSYNVRIRDAANTGCFVILNPAVVITEPVVLSATVTSSNVTCFGLTDGTITVSAPAGGHGAYEYSINGGGSWQATGIYTSVAPGTYNVQIRDAAYPACYKVLNAAVVISQPAVLQANVASTNISCKSADDGIINITAPIGGYGTYQYTKDGGTNWQNTGLFNGLTPGTYDVRIRDAAHIACELILNPGLQITEPPALSALVIDTDITCFGASDGQIQITNSAGGYGSYEYSDDGGATWRATGLFTLLTPGTYDVRMRDVSHITCVKILDPAVVISQPAVLNATVNHTDVTCNGANDGTITISAPSGGYGSYGYSINGGTSWQGSGNFTNLTPGTFNIRIRDAVNTGCVIALNPAVVITQPVILSASVVKTNINCNSAADGTITINGAAGGSGSYEYTVNGGATWQVSNSFTGLIPGFYNVKIRDAVNPGCIITINGSLNVTEPTALNANIAKTNVTCFGANNGTITISGPTGGYGTYEYSITGGTSWQGSGTFTNLAPNTYDVRIRDAAHATCVIILNPGLVISQPAILAATVTATNVTCNGANDGTISITGATGGSGVYEYTVTGGAIWSGLNNFTNRAPGNYDVRIRDVAQPACVIILNAALPITQPPLLAATVTRTNITCFGASNGTITISAATGGYGTYEYSINGGGSWQGSGNFTALGSGNYNVQIRDAAHTSCVIVLNNSVQITQPAVLNAVVTPTNVSCNGANNGIINITAPTGGYGTYEFSIDGGTNWQGSGLFSALFPATYDVRIRDGANISCVIILNNSLTITEPAAINANVTSVNVTCNGAGDGTIIVSSPTGGYGTYEYSKDGGATWQATGTFTNLVPASYNVQIRDKAHITCVAVLSPALIITQPALLSATVNSANITCAGANNGTITITNPLGGYGSYAYTINNGASWQSSGNFTNLSPGTYNVKIRDASNITCIVTLNAALVLTEPPVLSGTVSSSNVTCSGSGDGSITITNPLGGYGTYEYSIDGGTTWHASGNFTGVLPGFYNVQIRDGVNTLCVKILNGSLQITQPAALSANLVRTNVTCHGAGDGTITISSPSGGYGTYQYSDDGGTNWQASGIFTGLPPATYNVQIRDASHITCVTTLNATLIITEPALMTATVTPTMVTCNGSNDGIITITGATGGYGTYQYSTNGGTTWQGTGTFTNLAPVNYNVMIRDAANIACVVILNPALAITQPAVLAATVTKTNVSCFGGSDGTITVSTPTGGYGTYEYSINGGGAWQASGNFTALVPGNYNIQIRDGAHIGCVKVLNASLPVTQPAALNAVVTPTNVTCNGANDGIISITAPSGGSGTYGYTIDGGLTWLPSGVFNALTPGIYNVQIRDAANIACSIILNNALTITEPLVLNAVVSSVNINCNGGNDGTISITSPTGGYGTFEYTDDGGTTWQASGNFINLAPGPYNVQIRDKAHTSCVAVLNSALVITQPAAITAIVASTNVTCFGANNGTITITNPLGGYGTYAYSVNGGSTWQAAGTFTNLAPSTYIVKIRDAAHIACEVTLNPALVITQPAVLAATVTRTNLTCNGASDGTISISAPTGGSGTYQYTVDGGATWHASGSFNGLLPGFYNVQIRDAVNTSCVAVINGSLQLTQPAVLSAFISKSNVTCNGSSDGTITILGATGGYGTFQYSINGGTGWQISGSFTGLLPGTFNVQIRDAANAGCVKILDAALVITQPAALTATVTPAMATCFGTGDGKITISSPTGGYGSYQFSIDGGTSWQGSGTFTNLAPATYNVQIRDAGNISCVVILNSALVITQPVVLSASLAHTNVTCFGGNDGTITISSPAGGYGTYEYSINGGGSWQASGNFTLLSPGSYTVLIRDAGHTGCVVMLNNSYVVGQPALLSATVTKTDISCKGANDGTINISLPSGGYGTYQYSIDGGLSWVGSGNFVNLAPATYDIRIRDAVNTSCSVILYPNLVITEPILLALTSSGDIALNCFSNTDGTGTFYGSGGTMPYTFHVITNTTGATLAAPGFNSQTFFNAGAGIITIAITDFKGCFAQSTINITQPALLTPGTISANQVLCAGDNPAQLTETVPATGGPGAYNYQWQYGSTAAGPFINITGATGSIYTPTAGANNTLYYRRMITSGVCLPVYSNVIQVLVNPKPVAILTGGETICPAQTSILKVNMMVGTGPFELDIDNFGTVSGYVSGADIVVSPAVTTIYKLLRVRDANNCEVLTPSANLLGSATVIIRDLPSITTSPVNKTICEYGVVTFNVAATGSDLTYQWYVNTGSGFNPVADGGVYFGATNSTLSLFGATRLMNGYIYHAVVSGCSSTVTSADATLTVNTAPEIAVQPRDTTACMNSGAGISLTVTGTAISYQWQVNKGAGFINVVNDAYFSGSNLNTLTVTNAQGAFNNYIFRVIATGACGIPVYSNFAVLRVNIPPVVTLNPANKSACDGTGPVLFSANGSGVIDSLRWQVFSGGVWSDIHDNAIYSGSTSQQLTLASVPLALNGNLYRLGMNAKCITVNTTGATLTVNPNPVVDFSAVNPIHACGNVPLVINGNPTGGSGTWSSHLWTGDIGPLNNYFIQSPTFSSQIAGSYALNYKVRDNKGCTGNGDVTVLVDAPDATFAMDMSSGCTPISVTFTKDMTGIAKFWWDFGDSSPKDSINANPVHAYANIGSSINYYTVKLTVRSAGGCLASFGSTVTVYPSINATFTATPGVVCSGNQVILTTLPGASKYFWDFGDGISGYFSNTTNHLYTNLTTSPVIHTVTLTTTSFYNCTDVKTFDITVMPMPIPQFTALPVTQIFNAAGNPVTFTNTTNPGTWTWLWRLGDGTQSTDQNPVHTYTSLGTFDVVLKASNANCSDSVKHTVSVTPMPPVAKFDLIPSGCSPLTIEPNNTSLYTDTPGTTYMWDFGDGGASTSRNPSYVYFTPGTYRVELMVTGPGGVSNYSQVVSSYPSPKADFELTPQIVFVNDEKVRMFNKTQGADSYLWEFGDGDTSKVKDPFHKYLEEGTYDVTLWAYIHNVINGETVTCSDKYVLSPGVTVEPSGVIRFSTVFTPNKDGEIEMDHLPTGGTEIDQFFFPPIREKVINYKLQIFNRLGVLIFESHDINIPWNGYYHHKLCQQGVYVWYVEGKYANGTPFKKVGDVTLLH